MGGFEICTTPERSKYVLYLTCEYNSSDTVHDKQWVYWNENFTRMVFKHANILLYSEVAEF